MKVFFKVGRTFGYEGVLLKVVKCKNNSISCDGCYFRPRGECDDVKLQCIRLEREDGLDIIFKEVK